MLSRLALQNYIRNIKKQNVKFGKKGKGRKTRGHIKIIKMVKKQIISQQFCGKVKSTSKL
jgi:hypothetical protein